MKKANALALAMPAAGRWLMLPTGLALASLALGLTLGEFGLLVASRVLAVAIAAMGCWLVIGLLGVMSLGQAVFLAIGGYVVGLLSRVNGTLDLTWALPAAALAGAASAALMGAALLAGRRPPNAATVAVASLTLSVVAERALRGWGALGGQNGLPSLPPLTVAGVDWATPHASYAVASVLFVCVFLGVRLFEASRAGLRMHALRDDEQRLNLLGVDTARAKWTLFTAAGAVVGMAGGLVAALDGFVGPALAGASQSTQLLLYVLLSGGTSLLGVLAVTFAIEVATVFLSEWLGSAWPIVLGIAMVIAVCARTESHPVLRALRLVRSSIGQTPRPGKE